MTLRLTGLLIALFGFAWTIWWVSKPSSYRSGEDTFYIEAITEHFGHRIAFTPIQNAEDRKLRDEWNDRFASLLHVYADKANFRPTTAAISGAFMQLCGTFLVVVGLWDDKRKGILTTASKRSADADS